MSPAIEKHYTVGEVSELWNVSRFVVTTLFRDEKDVLKIRIGHVMNRAKTKRECLRIPESALLRVHENWSRRRTERQARSGGVK